MRTPLITLRVKGYGEEGGGSQCHLKRREREEMRRPFK